MRITDEIRSCRARFFDRMSRQPGWIIALVAGGAALSLGMCVIGAVVMPKGAEPDRVKLDLPKAGCPTRAKFDALHEGLSRDEVTAVMGTEGIVKSETGSAAFVNFLCLGPKRRVTAVFRDGKLVTKSADGLDVD